MRVWINTDGHVFETESVDSHAQFVSEMTEWADEENCTIRKISLDTDDMLELVDNVDGTRFALAQLEVDEFSPPVFVGGVI